MLAWVMHISNDFNWAVHCNFDAQYFVVSFFLLVCVLIWASRIIHVLLHLLLHQIPIHIWWKSFDSTTKTIQIAPYLCSLWWYRCWAIKSFFVIAKQLFIKHHINQSIWWDCIILTIFQIVMKYVNAFSVIFEAFTDKKFHLWWRLFV